MRKIRPPISFYFMFLYFVDNYILVILSVTTLDSIRISFNFFVVEPVLVLFSSGSLT